MSIAVPVNASARVRELREKQPHLTPAELATITGVPLKNVKAALQRTASRDKLAPRDMPAWNNGACPVPSGLFARTASALAIANFNAGLPSHKEARTRLRRIRDSRLSRPRDSGPPPG